ncbi:MATE family efflux transporter [Paenibacillus sambharensis]|uniref:Probable multidrug resistance protein NorM n=1 Tax=Paenibacillus sambharensis TaxID=1803190 RepID=A0A2W1LNN3_9BACL|nr:MATE family efflux transporter [Paenibacillus sambharensis]PZD96495.1 MATE family efflux transporter [Paenibacillus sambharensis]
MSEKDSFYKSVFKIAVPVTLQSLLMALLNLTDQLMVGQLGDTAIASVGMSTKIYGIIAVVLAGLSTGVSIFAAQFWGSKDAKSVSQVLGLGLIAGFTFTFLFSAAVFIDSPLFLSMFTTDANVIDKGFIFLQIMSLGFVPVMLTMMYSAILRSTGHAQWPMYVSFITVGVNVVLNYLLIFGNLGAPELGLQGAAIATLIARILECLLIIGAVYRYRLPGAVGLKNLFIIPRPLINKFVITTFPLLLTELVWVLGETAYAIIYSRMGTLEMTAMTITFPLQGLCIGLLSGLASAAGVLVGNRLGANEADTALNHAKRFIRLGIVISLVIGAIIAAGAQLYVSAFNISEEAAQMGTYIVMVFAGFLWVKVSNMIMAGGILVSGGDSKFVFGMEATATWLIGVPSGLLLALVWKQPVYLVYLIICLEEVARFIVGCIRIYSRRWMRNLVSDLAQSQ